MRSAARCLGSSARAVVLAAAIAGWMDAVPRSAGATTWRVPADVPTIQAGIDRASAGDDVLVAPGTYREHNIRMKGGITVHSEAGAGSTSILAEAAGVGFACEGTAETCTIEGFSIQGGRAVYGDDWHASGGGIQCLGAAVVIRDCSITDCYAEFCGGAIMAKESDVAVERCVISSCEAYGAGAIVGWGADLTVSGCVVSGNEASGAGAIFAFGPEVTILRCVINDNWATWGSTGGIACGSPQLTIRDCVLYDNHEIVIGGPAAIDVFDSVGIISGCTIAYNDGWNQGDPAVSLLTSDVLIEKTIIAFNGCAALYCAYDAEVNVSCCDFFGNLHGNDLCGDDLGGNFSLDPLFCGDEEDWDFALDAASPCLPGNHPEGIDCWRIGARGPGCGEPPAAGACCLVDGTCVKVEEEACAAQNGAYMGDEVPCEPNPCVPTATRVTTWGVLRGSWRR